MKAIALAGIALWIAAGCGRALLGRLHVWQSLSAEERFAFAAATGLGVGAYGVFALGLLGQLSFWPITLLWGLLAVAGTRSMLEYGREAVLSLRSGFAGLRAWQWIEWCGVGTLLACAGVALMACFLPPTGREWDAISYHLADPKLFLQMGRIVSLPTEHHSNFPFTMEMLFTVGLLYAGYPLANLFHFLTGVLTVIAMAGFCRRCWSSRAGIFAGMLYVTTPAVLWQCGVAYIDVALGLYILLAALAAVYAVESLKGDGAHGHVAVIWGGIAGVAMGFGLGIKYLALLPFGLIAMYLLARRVVWRAILIYLFVALLIGAPWYVKNWFVVHNPVYPYAYALFPRSRYWSADRAAAYQSEQASFGYEVSLRQPREAILNGIQSPWRLVADADRYANRGDYTFTSLFGGAFAALGMVLVLMRRVPGAVRDLFLLGVAQFLSWLLVAQVGRYLIPMLPVFSVTCGFVAWRLMHSPVTANDGAAGGCLIAAGLRYGTLSLVFGQAVLLFWGIFTLPSGSREAVLRGVLPTGLSVPDMLLQLRDPRGRETALRRQLDVYAACEWINHNAPGNAGVVLYDETRGFYLDRFYMWGNALHSAYIPYDTMREGSDLSSWMLAHGVRYALINLNWSPQRWSDPELSAGVVGKEQRALERWYYEGEQRERFRALIQDALRKGEWVPAFAQNGVVVLEIRQGER